MTEDLAVYGFPSEYRFYVVNSQGELMFIIEKDESLETISAKERRKIVDGIKSKTGIK